MLFLLKKLHYEWIPSMSAALYLSVVKGHGGIYILYKAWRLLLWKYVVSKEFAQKFLYDMSRAILKTLLAQYPISWEHLAKCWVETAGTLLSRKGHHCAWSFVYIQQISTHVRQRQKARVLFREKKTLRNSWGSVLNVIYNNWDLWKCFLDKLKSFPEPPCG